MAVPIASSALVAPRPAAFAGTPVDLHWSLLSSARHMRIMDEQFIHYAADYRHGLSGIAAVAGQAPTSGAAHLTIGGRSFYKTTCRPRAAWCAIEARLAEVPSAGRCAVGPALVRDAEHYLACVYDPAAGEFRVVVNGQAILVRRAPFPTGDLTLTMVCTANQITFWAQGPAGSVSRAFVGTVENKISDLLNDGALEGYGYGLVCDAEPGVSARVASLRAGVCGGVGTLNVRQVMNEDNSPYFHHGRLLFTADFENLGTRGYFNFTLGHATLFWLDMETFEVGTLGHYYFRRTNYSEPHTTKIVGGAAIKLTWHASRRQWLMNYTFADWPNLLMGNTDVYLWLEPHEIFGEQVLDQSRFRVFGRERNSFLLFDSRTYKVGDRWYLLGAQTNSPEGGAWRPTEPVRPTLYSGNDLDHLDGCVDRIMPNASSEAYTLARLGGRNYIVGWTNGSSKGWVFSFPDLHYLGDLQLSFVPHTEFPGYDFVPHQRGEKTSYYLIGYDNDALSLTDVEGKTHFSMWARGKLTVYKAQEEVEGCEFR